jgi:Cu/Ag efflux pump CusA
MQVMRAAFPAVIAAPSRTLHLLLQFIFVSLIFCDSRRFALQIKRLAAAYATRPTMAGAAARLVVVVMALLLSGYFRSVSLAAQVLLNIPLALMGGLALTRVLVDNVSIATLVGMIAVAGVAARNSIMLLSHYLHLMRHEGEGFTRAMITRGTLERIVPVLMTALSAGIALVPLLFAAHEPGKEILHPVAVVMVGGLISSTLLDLAVTPAVFWLFGRRAAERALSR